MKRCQTTKYRRQHKKERANRKARQLAEVRAESGGISSRTDMPLNAGQPQPVATVSPARKAFQDI